MTAPTAHIEALPGAISERVLLPGDPRRAEHIAQRFLDDVSCYNRVRNMSGFTGVYRGERISVQGTGMGMPSIALYATELFRHFGVSTAIRVGTCGAIQPDLSLREVIIGTAAHTDSAMSATIFGPVHYAPAADFALAQTAWRRCRELSVPARVGSVYSTDSFYGGDPQVTALLERYGVLAVDMEAAALYLVAAAHGARALTLLTVTDGVDQQIDLDAGERQDTLDAMIEVALDTLIEA